MAYQVNASGGIDYKLPANRATLPSDAEQRQTERGYHHTATETDIYLESKLIHRDILAGNPLLTKWYKRATDEGIPDIAVSALQGQYLSVLAKGMRAEKILEIGTLWGYSTYFLASVLPNHGQIDTLEFSPVHARIANEFFLDADLYPFPKVHLGDALETLRSSDGPFAKLLGTEEGLKESERGYDLVFIDADKDRVLEYFKEAVRLLRKGGVLLVDNAIRAGRIVEEGDDAGDDVKGFRRLYDWVEGDKGKTVMMSGIQTVGAKSWDGFLMAVKL